MDITQIGYIVAVFGLVRLVLKVFVELFFFLAHIFGTMSSNRAKWSGLACTWIALALSVLGGGTSNRYIADRFVRRQRSRS